jgi:hypothetical protein
MEIFHPKINKCLPVPPTMPPLVASLMHYCLVELHKDRPAFDEIANRIKRFVIDDVHPIGLRRNDERGLDLLLVKVFSRYFVDALREGLLCGAFFRSVQYGALPYSLSFVVVT